MSSFSSSLARDGVVNAASPMVMAIPIQTAARTSVHVHRNHVYDTDNHEHHE